EAGVTAAANRAAAMNRARMEVSEESNAVLASEHRCRWRESTRMSNVYLSTIMLQVRRSRVFVDRGQHLFDRVADRPSVQQGCGRHAFPDTVLEHGGKRFPEAVGVQEDDRLLVQVQSLPRQDFDGLFQRADAARRYDEGVRVVIHQQL